MRTILILLALSTSALAQQPDVAVMKKAIMALQSQRNEAMDQRINAEVQLAIAREEIESLKAELDALKKEKTKAK